jgi:hypothetical protein
MPLSTAPVARCHARSPFEAASTRFVSARTLDDTENAIAANAADSHSTVNSALPRRPAFP